MELQQLVVLALQASILLTVFGFGLRATANDVLFLVRRPGLLARSLVAMFVIMPIVAIALPRLFELRSSVQIALVALAISPLPPLLPKKEEKAGGHTSYALGLMATVAALSIVVVPLSARILGSYLGQPFAMSPGAIAQVVLKMALLPLAAGMVLHAILPRVARRIASPIALVANVLLTAGVLAILIAALPAVLALIGDATLVAMAAFVAVGLAVGHGLGGAHPDDQVVLALSTASRHPAIALAVAKANFPDEPRLGATILLYLLVNVLVGLAYMAWQRRHVAGALSAA